MHRYIPPRALHAFAAFLIISFMVQGAAFAQDIERIRQQERGVLEEGQLRGIEPELDTETELSQDLEFDYGGSFRFNYYAWDDGEGEHYLRITDIRIWGNMVYRDTHQLYARVMGEWQDYGAGSEYFYEDENDTSIPRLDVGYYKADLGRAFAVDDLDLRFKGGRDYYNIGVGMAVDRRGDGAELTYTGDILNLTAFVMHTISSEDGTDRSNPDFGHDKRIFSGIEAGHEFDLENVDLGTVELFGYTLWQRYNNDRTFPEFGTTQKFGDDTLNFGVGLRGEVGPNLTYTAEYSRQYGDKYTQTTNEKADIDAHAYNFEAEYTFRTIRTRPKISAQYIFGSGDSDAGNTLDTIGGNQPGTDYNAFTPFGYVDTGLAFFPQISNIKITRLGAAFCPFDKGEGCLQFEAGFSLFEYRRDKSNGGIADRFTVPGEGFLGREWDVYSIWRPFSDLSLMAQYGVFYPEKDSFSDDSNRYYFSIGTIIYF